MAKELFTQRLETKLPPAWSRKLDAQAEVELTSRSALARKAIREYLQKHAIPDSDTADLARYDETVWR